MIGLDIQHAQDAAAHAQRQGHLGACPSQLFYLHIIGVSAHIVDQALLAGAANAGNNAGSFKLKHRMGVPDCRRALPGASLQNDGLAGRGDQPHADVIVAKTLLDQPHHLLEQLIQRQDRGGLLAHLAGGFELHRSP